MLNNQGPEIKGVWETKEGFLFGSPLSLDILDKNNIVYEETEFCWDDNSEESDTTALVILLWFLDKNETFLRKKTFLQDFVMKFLQEDFETTFNCEYWLNCKTQRWGHMAKPLFDYAYSVDDD
ncbi:hypothetical protein RE476_04690 [Methanolobus mangrovi]|uniref:Uncharacterized protein n=1 Tax=Methanolobus mangrovi TaxID=3072977 RepID=A0AA51UH79_9EURY|nr:hypothetical protein [Methanolobus mangrovi]WMW23130.1 hypothetical protein RE476_04690 [Methanolobus mangrovi]